MKVICISGKAESGKDTSALHLKHILEGYNKSVLITHYADLVKFICMKYFDWNGEKDIAGRQMLQYVGTDVVRAECPSYWADFIVSVLKFFPTHWDCVIIPDCRFPNEIDTMRDSGFETYHLRIERPDHSSGLTPEQLLHSSETSLDNVVPDYIVTNNSDYSDLYTKLLRFTKEVLYEK